MASFRQREDMTVRTYEDVTTICKRYIAEELREHGYEVNELGVELVRMPIKEPETLDLLKNGLLEYRAAQRLERLAHVWSVKGKHREVPGVTVELLVGEYNKGFSNFARLGKREGLKWVSAIS